MKKLLFLTIATLSLISCSSDNNSDNSTGSNVDYEFTITVDGVVHKVKGNTANGIPKGSVLAPDTFNWIDNTCIAQISSQILLGINDITEPNYVSGQHLTAYLYFNNLALGVNQMVYPSNIQIAGEALSFSTTSGSTVNSGLPITITDLGTNIIKDYPPYNFGRTLKGNYSGTVYKWNPSTNQYTVPTQLSIDFKVLRFY